MNRTVHFIFLACAALFFSVASRAQSPLQPPALTLFSGDAPPIEFNKDVDRQTGWWSIEADAGPSLFHITGDVASLFSNFWICQCMSFIKPTTDWGWHTALRGVRRLGPGVSVSLAAEYLRYSVSYINSPVPYPYWEPKTSTVIYFTRTYHATLSVNELAVEPSLRIDMGTLPLFVEVGTSVATIFSQSAHASMLLTPENFFPRSDSTYFDSTSSHAGTPQIQISAFTGVGAYFIVMNNFMFTAAIRARLGFTPLFKESSAKIDYAIEPTVGVGYSFF